MYAAFILIDLFFSLFKMIIETKFPSNPIKLTHSIKPKEIFWGVLNLSKASNKIKIAIAKSDNALIKAVNTSVLLNPKVCFFVAFFSEIFSPK